MKIRKFNENVEDLNTSEWYYELRAYDDHGSGIKNSEYHVLDPWENQFDEVPDNISYEGHTKNLDLFTRTRDNNMAINNTEYTYVIVKITTEVVD